MANVIDVLRVVVFMDELREAFSSFLDMNPECRKLARKTLLESPFYGAADTEFHHTFARLLDVFADAEQLLREEHERRRPGKDDNRPSSGDAGNPDGGAGRGAKKAPRTPE